MAKGKLPGIDGLISEVFSSYWHFIELFFVEMLIHFGETSNFYTEFNEEVFKIFPKKVDHQRIKDSWPIAMLNTIYKLIAKLLAQRLYILLPSLVNKQ